MKVDLNCIDVKQDATRGAKMQVQEAQGPSVDSDTLEVGRAQHFVEVQDVDVDVDPVHPVGPAVGEPVEVGVAAIVANLHRLYFLQPRVNAVLGRLLVPSTLRHVLLSLPLQATR